MILEAGFLGLGYFPLMCFNNDNEWYGDKQIPLILQLKIKENIAMVKRLILIRKSQG